MMKYACVTEQGEEAIYGIAPQYCKLYYSQKVMLVQRDNYLCVVKAMFDTFYQCYEYCNNHQGTLCALTREHILSLPWKYKEDLTNG